jgi:hypothetical protein
LGSRANRPFSLYCCRRIGLDDGPPCGGSSCGASAGLSMEVSGKSGGAGGIIDWPSEYIVDVRLGERALCAEDP